MAKVFSKKKKQRDKNRGSSKNQKDIQVKRCPECFVNLPIDARECFSCHAKVGGIDKHGRAKKRGTWVSYLICIIAWALFIGYIKWAFL